MSLPYVDVYFMQKALLELDAAYAEAEYEEAGDLILGPCRAMVPQLVLADEAKNVPVVTAELGPLASAVGAACLARESLAIS